MSKPPAFQFYAADYLADEQVQLMTLEEEGIYIRLLAYCWREGTIPADTRAIARLCKGASDEAINGVLGCFEEHPNCAGRLMHPRLEKEREKQEAWSKKQSRAGRESGKVRREKKLHAEQVFNTGSTDVHSGSNQTRTKTNSSFASASSSSDLNTNTSCAEAKQVRSAPDEVPESELAGKLPLAGGGEYRISKAQVAEWAKLFPGIDVMHECRKLKAWLIGNPTKQSTKRGILKRIMNWLTRAQDDLRRGGGMNGGNANRAQERTNANRAAAREALSQLLEPDAGNGGGAWGEPERGGPEVIRGDAVAL